VFGEVNPARVAVCEFWKLCETVVKVQGQEPAVVVKEEIAIGPEPAETSAMNGSPFASVRPVVMDGVTRFGDTVFTNAPLPVMLWLFRTSKFVPS